MANPVLSERTFQRERNANAPGWGAPEPFSPYRDGAAGPVAFDRRTDRMTRGGVATATGVLFVILLATGAIGWASADPQPDGQIEIPVLAIVGAIGGLIVGLVTGFKPRIARFTAPVYAAFQGLFLGAISRSFNEVYDGIVLQAVAATIGVFAVMWFLYATRIIRVTERFRRVVLGATIAVFGLMLVSMLQGLFSSGSGFMWSNGTLGILLSVVVVGVAAMNLAIDFDMVDRGVESGAPRYMEWYAAFGLMVTLVWLYLELLRLLSKLRDR